MYPELSVRWTPLGPALAVSQVRESLVTDKHEILPGWDPQTLSSL